MRTLLHTLAIAAALLLCSCERTPSRGIVAKKRHTPASSSVTVVPTGNGNVSCVPMYTPESWGVCILPLGESSVDSWVYVTVDEKTYNALEVGGDWEYKGK